MLKTFDITTLTQTQSLAQKLAPQLPNKGLVNFHGTMGLGKTTFISALISQLYTINTILPEIVTSPTYSLVHEYDLRNRKIAHFDLYRLEYPEAILELGFDDYLDNALCLVEWPENGGEYTKNPMIKCEFFFNNDTRHLTLTCLNAYKLDI